MGMFDTIIFKNTSKEEVDIQFKNGYQILEEYKIGDKIHLANGLYFAREGVFVVFENNVVAAFDNEDDIPFMFDKWGGILPTLELPS